MKARSQSEHEAINRREYPGTRQLCERCGEPTERCEEDAIYTDSGEGPMCVGCYESDDRRAAVEKVWRKAAWKLWLYEGWLRRSSKLVGTYPTRKAAMMAYQPNNPLTHLDARPDHVRRAERDQWLRDEAHEGARI